MIELLADLRQLLPVATHGLFGLACLLIGWVARRILTRDTLELLAESRAESKAAAKLAALRAENERLAVSLHEAQMEAAKYRRSRAAADKVLKEGA